MSNASNTTPEELKTRAGDLAKDTSSHLATRANEAGAKGMTSIADSLDRAAERLDEAAADQERIPSDKVAVVSGRVHDAANYLREKDPRGMLSDVDGAIQRHPYRAMAAGLAIGWVIGRLMSRD